MCGIFCALKCGGGTQVDVPAPLNALLENRGPNFNAIERIEREHYQLLIAGYVLWQQGAKVQQQPVQEEHITLLFNGDIYNIEERKPLEMADSAWLAQEIAKCEVDEDILALFRTLEGPFSLIFYDSRRDKVYFGRDALGRNSLIIEREDGELRLGSTSYYETSKQNTIMELPPLGLYVLNAKDAKTCTLLPWTQLTNESQLQKEKLANALELSITAGKVIAPNWLELEQTSTDPFDFYQLCSGMDVNHDQVFIDLLEVPAVKANLSTFHELISESVRERVQQKPPHCRDCLPTLKDCLHAKVAVLFSGGIDCSILALLADKYIHVDEPIELINIAFERAQCNNIETVHWQVPDRLSAHEAYKELARLCPKRIWQFIEVNVTRKELAEELQAHIKHLIYPLTTVLDESIGCAFWFAARGAGALQAESTARVIIIGSGADELFGGYTRHRNAYKRCKGTPDERQSAVHDELELDWLRIPSRNLARDDRVIADNGKTSRAPYIEERVVKFIRGLPPSQRCCFTLPEGVGDKLLLRLYGYQLGLRMPAQLKKRAIQFGSRIANKKQNAKDQSTYLSFETIVECS